MDPYKAPGADGIPNVVLMQAVKLNVPHLGPLNRTTFFRKVYPDSMTCVCAVYRRSIQIEFAGNLIVDGRRWSLRKSERYYDGRRGIESGKSGGVGGRRRQEKGNESRGYFVCTICIT